MPFSGFGGFGLLGSLGDLDKLLSVAFGFPPGFGPCGSRLTFCNFLAFDLSLIFLVV